MTAYAAEESWSHVVSAQGSGARYFKQKEECKGKYKNSFFSKHIFLCVSLTLREEHGLRVFANRVLRIIFGLKEG
jgi:hypothetical protein